MFLLDTIRTLKSINKAKKLMQDNEDVIDQVKASIVRVQNGIHFLEEHKDNIHERIDVAEAVVERLWRIIEK